MKLQDMNSKTNKPSLLISIILGVAFLGIIANTNNPGEVTPSRDISIQPRILEPYPPSNPYKAVPYKYTAPSNESLEESEYDIYIDKLDSYYDDPENLDENPDEIFDFLLD